MAGYFLPYFTDYFDLPPTSGIGTYIGRTVLDPKRQMEVINEAFDFVSWLAPGEDILTAVVTASVYSGNDMDPSALILGSAEASGTKAFQLVAGGTIGAVYDLLCTVTTNVGETLSMAGYLAVVPDLP